MAKSRLKGKPGLLDRAAQLTAQGSFAEAERLYAQALRKDPGSAAALRGQARLLRQTGRAEEAIELLRKAVRVHPHKVDLRNELCVALMLAGHDDQEVIEVAEEAIRAAPQSPIGYFQLGQIYRRRFEPAAAIQILEEGIQKAGNDWYLERLLAAAYADHGDTDRALELYERVAQADPRDADVQTEFANLLRNVGRFDEARRCYEQAMRRRAGDPATIAGLAELHESMREYQKASALVTQAIYSGVAHPDVILAYARVCRRSNNPTGATPLLERLADDPRQLVAARSSANMMLGALLEDMEQYDRAFERYRIGNEQAGHSFDPSSITRTIDGLITVFGAATAPALPRASTRSDLPVFIVGMPRTGTSLVEQILASHPQVHGSGERHDISRLAFSIPDRLPVNFGGYPQCVRGLTQDVIDDMAHEYLEKLKSAAPEAQRFIDKNPFNFLNLGFIALLAPGARIIHCTRDPLDTCFSIFATRLSSKNDYSNDLGHIAAFFRDYRRIMDHWRTVLDLPILDLSYEALVDDLQGGTRALLEFVGLHFDERCIRFHESERYTRTLSTDQVRRPIYRSSIGRARHFEAHLGGLKEALSGLR